MRNVIALFYFVGSENPCIYSVPNRKQSYEVGDNKDVVMVIYVPMAKREQKPVYINNDIFNGTFRRNYEGDYHCTRLQVKTMLRDQTERTMDMEVLDKVSIGKLFD